MAVDADNRVYNIEIQRSDKGAGAKRARYNSSLMDANVTEPGEKYENLCESYVIFITENDIMKVGLPIYHIDRTVKETGECLVMNRILYMLIHKLKTNLHWES